MKANKKKRTAVAALLAIVAGSGAASSGDWPKKSGNALSQHYSALAEINPVTIERLGLAWSLELDSPDGVAGTPIVVDGVIYLGAAYSVVYAVDAASGELLWRFDPNVRAAFADYPRLSWLARASRGVAVADDRVYLNTADCRLIALNAGDGRVLWTRQTCDPAAGYGISDSPYTGAGLVFVGNAGSESGMKVRSYVSAYDGGSGELVWRFYIVPSDDPDQNRTPAMKMAAATWSGDALATYGGGGSAWNEMTYDPATGLLFFGTGGALPYPHPMRSPDGGDNLFLSSIVALDAATGEYVWHYQTVPADSWEYNATMNIVLGELDIDGKRRDVLMTAPKNGFHYVLDRRSGELLRAAPFARITWASHINVETGRPVMTGEADYWRPDAPNEVLVWPNMWGAHSWRPMAWHPEQELVYIPVVDVPSVVSNYADGDFDDTLKLITEIDGEPFAPGKLVALDPVSGKARWRVEQPLPFNGGVLATGGNLVFQGDALGQLRAFAADSGRELWSFDAGTAIAAAPVSYMSGGRQHVLAAAGGGGGLQFVYPELHAMGEYRGPTRLLAFALDGKAALPEAGPDPRPRPQLPEFDASDDDIARGEQLYTWYCAGCHGANAVARAGGSVPDLRYSGQAVHARWRQIVIDGERQAAGMPALELDTDEAEAIRRYVLARALAAFSQSPDGK